MTEVLYKKFLRFLESADENGELLIERLVKKYGPFKIRRIIVNGVDTIEVDNKVLPQDPRLPLIIFKSVIEFLYNSKDHKRKRGTAIRRGIRLCDEGLTLDTVEGFVAHKFYEKKCGDTVYKRISAIANILITSGVCRHEPGHLVLNLENLFKNHMKSNI